MADNILSHITDDADLLDIGDRINQVLNTIPNININVSSRNDENFSRELSTALKTLNDPSDKNNVFTSDNTSEINNLFFQNKTEQDFNSLFNDVKVPTERLTRYTMYDEFIETIPIMKPILDTYLDNLIPKNPISNKCFQYKSAYLLNNTSGAKENEEDVARASRLQEAIMTHFDLAFKLRNKILPDRLKYGDVFVEVVDLELLASRIDSFQNLGKYINSANGLIEYDMPKMKQYSTELFESRLDDLLKNNIGNKNEIDSQLENFYATIGKYFSDHVQVPEDLLYQLQYLQEQKLMEAENDKTNKNNDEVSYNFDKILLRIINPKDIIILETKSGTRVGYIEVSRTVASVFSNITQGLSATVGKIISTQQSNQVNKSNRDTLINKMVKFVYDKISEDIKVNNQDNPDVTIAQNKLIESALKNIQPQLIETIKKIVVEQSLNTDNILNKINTRFIPVHKIVHFATPGNTRNNPYSASIFDQIILPSKLYMLSQLSNVITKLSRASVIRKWRFETGASNRHTELLQNLKKQLFNSRITLDDLSNFRTVPKIFSDYKDMFVFTKQGQSLIDVDVMPMGDPNIKVQDLEDARREIIALSGVPSSYLGYADVVEIREALVSANVAFAAKISNQQENDCNALNKLVDIISEMVGVNYRPTDFSRVMFIPPSVLKLQVIEQAITSISNIQQSFGTMLNSEEKVDITRLLKEYVPDLDWDSLFKTVEQREIVKITTDEIKGTNEAIADEGMAQQGPQQQY